MRDYHILLFGLSSITLLLISACTASNLEIEFIEPLTQDQMQKTESILANRLFLAGFNRAKIRNTREGLLVSLRSQSDLAKLRKILESNFFTAKSSGRTIFKNTKEDIHFVCRTEECSFVDCDESKCGYEFDIEVSDVVFQRILMANQKNHTVLEFYLDDVKFGEIPIDSSDIFKKKVRIESNRDFLSEQQARAEMEILQILMLTGSFPSSITLT